MITLNRLFNFKRLAGSWVGGLSGASFTGRSDFKVKYTKKNLLPKAQPRPVDLFILQELVVPKLLSHLQIQQIFLHVL